MANESALSLREEAYANAAALFAGPGEVRSYARELDWSKSPLGPTTGWSPALRTMARSIFDSPFPICLWSGPEFALIYNDAYRRILTAKHPSALGQPGSIVWAEIWQELQPQFEGVRAGGEPVYFEDAPFVMARLDGGGTETAWFNYSLSPLRDEDGSIAAILNITPETTARILVERKLAEEQAALAASEANARLNVERVKLAMAAGAIIGTWVWDLVEDRFTVDDGFAVTFALDDAARSDVLTLAQIMTAVHPEDRESLSSAIEAAMARGGFYLHQYRTRRADGNYRWLEANGRVDLSPDGSPTTFSGVLIDIEERRAVEAMVRQRTSDLEAALEAKTLLLHEVDHRVKNNLTMIGALLRLQSRQIADPAITAKLDVMMERIDALATVHRRLYQSDDVTKFDIAGFAASMASGVIGASGRTDVKLVVDIEPIEVQSDYASSLGLILNEMLTNVIKHGLSDGRSGTIRLTARSNGTDYVLSVEDDGHGIDLGKVSDGLGRTLISRLSKQAGAKVTWERLEPGTRVTLNIESSL